MERKRSEESEPPQGTDSSATESNSSQSDTDTDTASSSPRSTMANMVRRMARIIASDPRADADTEVRADGGTLRPPEAEATEPVTIGGEYVDPVKRQVDNNRFEVVNTDADSATGTADERTAHEKLVTHREVDLNE